MRKIAAALGAALALAAAMAVPMAVPAAAATTCTFTTVGTTMRLDGDCTTDATILVPNGFTLAGQGKTITALDPPSGHFVGAVVGNAGPVAHVRDLTVTASGLSNVCDAGADRLRGIMFDGASGSIHHNTVTGINQGVSGCQEGNAIEVRKAPFDGTHPGTVAVVIAHNDVTAYQKTGIVANGDVSVEIHHNDIGSANLPYAIAANSIQLGFGAAGTIAQNKVDGNQWCGTTEDTAATAILLFDPAPGASVSHNQIQGNSDVGIYVFADDATITNNKVSDQTSIADCNAYGYDIGIGDYGIGRSRPASAGKADGCGSRAEQDIVCVIGVAHLPFGGWRTKASSRATSRGSASLTPAPRH